MEFLRQHQAKMAQLQHAAVAADEQASVMARVQERMERIEAAANAPYVRPPGVPARESGLQ